MKEKNENIKFLNLIYQNAQMGLIGIDSVIGKVENEDIAKLISEQRCEYEHIIEDTVAVLVKYGAKEEEIGKLKKVSSKIMSINKDDKNIVKLMMEGNEKGVIAITEKINKYNGGDEEILSLAKKLLATEEHNREEFKQYL